MKQLDIEATIEARLEMLRHKERTTLESPDQQQQYATVLEDTYATFARVETSVEELGQELEYHHERLGKRAEPEEKNI